MGIIACSFAGTYALSKDCEAFHQRTADAETRKKTCNLEHDVYLHLRLERGYSISRRVPEEGGEQGRGGNEKATRAISTYQHTRTTQLCGTISKQC